MKRTVLHDLYEKEGQSPWYDNLCRPVTDLLPLIASGVRGVTSNPAVIMHILLILKLCSFFFGEGGWDETIKISYTYRIVSKDAFCAVLIYHF